MTRLPDLERQLFEAARALERKPRRWLRISLLSGGATLALAATAVGAAQLLLPEGDPVPKAPSGQHAGLPTMEAGTSRLITARASDPAGGLPWGLAVARSADGTRFCAQVGRVQGGRLGVVGRDGTFNDDGRFHPLAADANQGGSCGATSPSGDLQLSTDGPLIPASGFTGGFLSAAGGCRERAADPESTVSARTRRELRSVPVCDASSLRDVKYGFAGREAVKIEYGGETVRPDPAESGAYIFVLEPAKRPRSLRITYKDGTSSSPGDADRGRSTTRSPVPREQARALAVLRRAQTQEDRSPAVTDLLRRGLSPVSGARGVRTDAVRLLRRGSDGVTVLVSIERLGREPNAIQDALCVLSSHQGRAPEIRCGSLQDVLRGRVRWTLPPAGLVPDAVAVVRIHVTGGKTVEAPVHDNYYDLTRPAGEQYVGIAAPQLIDKDGRVVRPAIDHSGG